MHSSSSRPSSNGLTLVEVVASILLVGTLLVAVLTAHRHIASQTRLAQQRFTAIAALDSLLLLRENPGDLDAGELQQPSGKIPGENPYHWRTVERREPGAEPFAALVLRLEVFRPDFGVGTTLASVEVLTPGGQGVVNGQ